MKHGLGVVIGKFYPPHRGHKLLIGTAQQNCEKVVVIVCERESDEIPGGLRQNWLKEIHPEAEVMLIDDRYDEKDSRVWAENTIRWLGRAPDAVFTSEDYGDKYAGLMGAKHVLVDRPRKTVPVCATAIRSDPYAHWDFLEKPVRSWYTKRVCVLGAESTGTTTLAKDLAQALRTVWVEEYGRGYSEQKIRLHDPEWRSDEFVHIAQEQVRRENASAREANRVLICDTNAFATVLWHRRYMGCHNACVEQIAKNQPCDLYLLTGDEIPFVQDGLRDGEHIRHQMHQWFLNALKAQALPWHLVQGFRDQRLTQALARVEALFAGSKWRPLLPNYE
ncbi:MAG TPA: AAA family ATPase [Clostridia bacterium]|nr:AAA family ATPase [Clostridia bacterium]